MTKLMAHNETILEFGRDKAGDAIIRIPLLGFSSENTMQLAFAENSLVNDLESLRDRNRKTLTFTIGEYNCSYLIHLHYDNPETDKITVKITLLELACVELFDICTVVEE